LFSAAIDRCLGHATKNVSTHIQTVGAAICRI
jgi:hypothetical protein